MLTRKPAAWWAATLIALLTIASGATALRAQSSTDTPVPEPPVIDKTWPDVNLNVVVINKQGVPQTIDEPQFQLFEDGVERPLQFRGSPDSPVSLAFLIDCSGSMFHRQGSIAAAVHAILNDLPNGSEVMEICFSDEAFLDLPFTPVSGIDYSFLDHMDARGGTALYDAVVVGEKYFAARARYVRRAVVLISDGGDNLSHSKKADAIRSLQWPGAPTLYSFLLPDTEVSGVRTQHDKVAMDLFAKAGGGVLFTPKEKDFESAIARLAEMIRSQSVLYFTAANPARNGVAHKLDVRLPDKDLEIRAIPEYFAPAR